MAVSNPYSGARAVLVGLLFLAVTVPAAGQQGRIVIGTNVACREAPDTSASVTVLYTLGDFVYPRTERRIHNRVWYNDTARVPGAPSPGCWIYGPLTTPWSDRERALLVAADHVLARTGPVPFEDYVAVDNLLSQTTPGGHADTPLLESSPLLQLRRFQVLERAARAPGTGRRTVRRDPLKSAWFFANRDVLRYHEPAGGWMLSADVYWRLYERHQGTRWAEEIAWEAAQGAVLGDECDAGCVLDRMTRTYARYWGAFPDGRWVDEAISRAHDHADYGTRAGCAHSTAAEVAGLAERVRDSLRAVAVPGKEALLAVVRRLQGQCAGA